MSVLKRDIPLKIAALFIALLIWFWATEFESRVTVREFTAVRVRVANFHDLLSRGYNIIGNSEFQISVSLEGRNTDLNRLNSAAINAYIDLRDVERAGEVSLPIQITEMNDAEVVDKNRSHIILYIDRHIDKSVPVVGEIIRMARYAGIETGDLVFTPSTISVSGPEQIINTISHAQVHIDLGDDRIERSRNVRETFILVDQNGDEVSNPHVRVRENTVEAFIEVQMTREMPLRVNYLHGYYDENHVQVRIIPDRIMLRGSPEYLSDLEEIIIGTIDEKTIDADITRTFPIRLDGDVRSLSGITSAEVEITFTDMATRTIAIPAARFTVIPPPENFGYTVQEANLRVRLFGPTESIGGITPSGVSVTVDLSELTEEGMHTVPVDAVVTVEDSPVFCIWEYSINVEIYSR